MRIAVTGSRGFLGTRVLARLRAAGHDVLGIGRHAGPSAGPHGSRYARWQEETLESLVPASWRGEPFTLVDLAWEMSRPRFFVPYADHVQRLSRLLDAWTPLGLERLLAAGSAEELGSRPGQLDESALPQGSLSPYGWSKHAARLLAESWTRTAQTAAVWFRPFVVYGPGQTGNMLIPSTVARLRQSQPVDLTDGFQERDFVHVDDVAEAFALAVERPSAGFQLFHLGTGQGTTVRALVTLLADRLGRPELLRWGALDRRPGEPALQIADPREAEQRLTWRARITWREGIEQIIRTEAEGLSWAA